MDNINVIIDNGDGTVFDSLLNENREADIPQFGEGVDFVTKDKGTVNGNTIVMISFMVVVNGEPKRVQAVVTQRLLLTTLEILKASAERKAKEGN